MVDFKSTISNPKDGKTYPIEVTGHHANSLVGKKIGDEVDGIFVGLPGYKLQITGGTDKDGFPMRRDITGAQRKRVLVSRSTGFLGKTKNKKSHPVNTKPARRDMSDGVRKKKTVRGNTISPDIVQINMSITQQGPKPVEDLLKEESK